MGERGVPSDSCQLSPQKSRERGDGVGHISALLLGLWLLLSGEGPSKHLTAATVGPWDLQVHNNETLALDKTLPFIVLLTNPNAPD